jgi:hypothetical protein
MKKKIKLYILFYISTICFFGINPNVYLYSEKINSEIPKNSIRLQGYCDYTDRHLTGRYNYFVTVMSAVFISNTPFQIVELRVNKVTKPLHGTDRTIISFKNYSLKPGDLITIQIGYKNKSGLSNTVKYVTVATKRVGNLIKSIQFPPSNRRVVLSFYKDTLPFKWSFIKNVESSTLRISKMVDNHTIINITGHFTTHSFFRKHVSGSEFMVPKRLFVPNNKYWVAIIRDYNRNNFLDLSDKVTQSQIPFIASYRVIMEVK